MTDANQTAISLLQELRGRMQEDMGEALKRGHARVAYEHAIGVEVLDEAICYIETAPHA